MPKTDRSNDSRQRAVEQFRRQGGMLRTKDVLAAGVHPRTLYALRDEGIIECLSRGRCRFRPGKASSQREGNATAVPRSPAVLRNGTSDAAAYYRTIRDSDLPTFCKETLQEVFVSWLEQRFKYLGKKDMEMILLGELPELEETQCGKDLIRIGETRGLAKAIVRYLLTTRAAIRARV